MSVYDDNYQQALRLVSKLIPVNDKAEELPVQIEELKKIIDQEIPNFLREDAPSNSPEIYYEFQHEYDKFVDFIKFSRLANRNIVSLGGSFSSGKSSFINTILGRKILPSEVDPTTSVPTYLINGNEDCVYALNLFGSKLSLDLESLKQITHSFSEDYEIALGRLLQKIYIEAPEIPYRNLAFLDTPGYSKADSDTYSKNTDEKIARAQLNSSNFILWFINVENGTIPESDIQFLQSVPSDIPKLLIVNKCDKKEMNEVKQVVNQIAQTLNKRGILVEGVVPYSCRKPNLYSSEPILKMLNSWDYSSLDLTFAKNFKLLFMECSKYFDQMLLLDGKRRERISKAMLEIRNETLLKGLSELIKEIDANRNRYRQKEKRLQQLKVEFFTQLKAIGDQCGIPLPEPNEIDLIRETAPNPMDVINAFKKKQGVNTSAYSSMIKNHLKS